VQIDGTAGLRRQARAPSIHRIVEDVVGCKWTLHVLAQVRGGVHRPGALVRTAEGLTTKVLNERLSKLVRYGVLEKQSFPEVPPRVEYRLTPMGERLNGVLDAIAALQDDVDRQRVTSAATRSARRPRARS
jgi:DNA-binding HxlR family transcriptional regulator